MRRKPIQETTKYRKLIVARNFIEANQLLFYYGNSFPITYLATELNIPFPEHSIDTTINIQNVSKFNLKMTSWQIAFNTILNKRGLYMAKRNSEYQILTKKKTKEKVKSLLKQSKRKKYSSKQLSLGLTNYSGNYTHVTNEELVQSVKFYRDSLWD